MPETGRIAVDDAREDFLFGIFDSAQGIQRRVFRILARRFYNEHALKELRTQAQALVAEIDRLGER